MTLKFRPPLLASALAGVAFAAITLVAPAAGAVTISPQPVVNPCIYVIGTPDPCAPPPPDRPDPVDPGCLRVDIEPLRCPYQP